MLRPVAATVVLLFSRIGSIRTSEAFITPRPPKGTHKIPIRVTTARCRSPSDSPRYTELYQRQTSSEIIQDRPGTAINRELLSQLSECKTAKSAERILIDALSIRPQNGDDKTCGPLFASLVIPKGATSKSTSNADLAIQTNIRNTKFPVMELIETNGQADADRASFTLFCVMIASMGSAVVANEIFPGPEIIRFVVVWILSFSPLFFVGAGLAIPQELQRFLIGIQSVVLKSYRRRMVQHEAGHFLMGHLMGIPVKSYQTNAIKNAVEFYPLSDTDAGRRRAKNLGFDVSSSSSNEDKEERRPERIIANDRPFFAEGGKGDELLESSVFRDSSPTGAKAEYYQNMLKLPKENNPTESWPFRGFDEATLDKLAVISLSGVCAEIISFGNAEGGYADLAQLRQFFAAAEPKLTDGEMENRIRFSVGYGVTQLRRHIGALDALADVMARDGSVEECVLAIETCEDVSVCRSSVNGKGAIMGDPHKRRREMMKSEESLFERILLRGGKNADVEDSGIVEGKGGGDRMEKFQLTGDDPLYAALAAAFSFFVWAANGGLSLH